MEGENVAFKNKSGDRALKNAALVLFLVLFVIVTGSGQTNKTLQDSVFKAGDLIKIPEIIYDNTNQRLYNFSKDSIQIIADFLNKHKNLLIEIDVHTDSRGSSEMNLKISERRAKNLYDDLLYTDVDKDRLKYKGYGESQVLYSDATINKVKTRVEQERLHQLNRRTELKVLKVL
jgi:outer membrane protein OmpA-like peptidoglycan-associated protein